MENFEIEKVLKTLNNKKIYILLIIIVTLAIGYIYSYYFVTPMYKSSATIILTKVADSNEEQVDTITQSDITLNQKLVSTYTQIFKSSRVLNSVIQKLNIDMTEQQLQSNIDIQSVSGTEILKISVTNKNPELTATIANELVKVFEQEVTSIYNINNVSIIDQAQVPISPYNINHAKDIIISFFIGIMLSIGLVFILYIFDTTIKMEEDVEEYIGLNVLSSIPIYTKKSKTNSKEEKFEELITYEDIRSPISEAFRTLRTNLVFGQEKDLFKTILVTSSNTSEGKSWISSNMAVTFAQTNKKVLIIDCDLRKGRQHQIFNVSSRPGLSNCLTKLDEFKSINDISKYIKETDIPNLHIMTGGDRPSNPSELISSKRMNGLLNIMNQMYDIVILDGTPSSIVSDSIVLSRIADATIIVTSCKETKIKSVQKIKKLIENAGGKIAGAVINKMLVSQKVYQNKYYYSDEGDKREVQEIEQKDIQTETVEELLTRLNSNIKQNQEIIDNANIRQQQRENQIDKSLFGQNILKSEKYDDVNAIQYKIENINNEIDTIKNIFAQILINSQNQLKENIENKIQSQTLKDKLDDVKLICRNIEEIQNTNTLQKTADEIKIQIDQINKACQKLNIKDMQTKEIINTQLLKMQENYNNMLDEKLSVIKDTDSAEQVKKKLTDLQRFIATTVSENNNEKELQELKNKLEDIEQIYKSYEQKLDEKLYKMQKNIIEATKEQKVEKFKDRINSVKEVYSKELETKLRALEERLIQNNNSKTIEDKVDEIKLIYTDKLEQNLTEIINQLSQNTKTEDIEQIENKIEQIKNVYLEQLNSRFQNVEDIFIQNNRTENIQNIESNLEEFKNIHSTQIEKLQKDIQNIMEQTTKSTELQEFKNLQQIYKQELNEKLSNLENILVQNNNSENITQIKQEIQILKNIYSQELEEKIKSLQQMINQNAKAEELQKTQQQIQYLKDTYNKKIETEKQSYRQLEKEMIYLKEELYELKNELSKQSNNRKTSLQQENKKLIKIEEIKNEQEDPHMIKLNNMKAEMEMHKQYKNLITDNYINNSRQNRKEKKGILFGKKEESSLFAVRQSFMEDSEQIEPLKKTNSISQILKFDDDSQVM